MALKMMMHKKRIIKALPSIFCGLIILVWQAQVKAQITVGSGTAPAKAAILQIKEQEPTFDDSGNLLSNVTAKGGLLLPRVVLEDPESLRPLVSDADANADSGKLKLLLIGLMVYHTKTIANKFEPGLYIWDGKEWAEIVYIDN